MLRNIILVALFCIVSAGIYSQATAGQQSQQVAPQVAPQVAMSQRADEKPAAQQPAQPAPQPAPEVHYDIKTITTFPDGHRLPKEQFLKETKYFSNQKVSDPNLVFRVRLPQNWTSTFDENNYANTLSSSFLSDVGRFWGPAKGDVRPFLSIQAKRMDDEFFAEDWFKGTALMSGFNLRSVKVHSYKEVEAIYSAIEGDSVYAIRARVIISGDILFFIKFAVPLLSFDEMADIQAHVLKSFELKEPSLAPVETQKNFSLLDAGYFYFPSSWYIKNVNFSLLDRLSVEVHRVESASQITYGQIFVRAIRKKQGTSLPNEIQNIVGEIEKREWKLEKLIERSRIIPPQGFQGGAVEIYDVQVKNNALDQELWFSYYESPTHYIFVSMYTPAREISFNDWAKNKAVFYLILRNFQLAPK